MANKKSNSTCQYPSTIDELIDDMEKHPDRYKHLQFILNRKKHQNLGLGQRFLLVNRTGFGLYVLNSVDYRHGIITMILTNPDSRKPSEINLDICNEYPDVYLINWMDVEEMVFTGKNFDCTEDELLELDNE